MDIIKAQDIAVLVFTIEITMIALEVAQSGRFAILVCVDVEAAMKKDMVDAGIELPILRAGAGAEEGHQVSMLKTRHVQSIVNAWILT